MAPVLKVVHVVATDSRRGAEVFAADLVGALACSGVEQAVAVLRAAGRQGPPYQAPVHALGTDRGLTVLGVGGQRVLGLRRLLRAERGVVVQAHGGEALKHALAAAAALAATPVVYRRIGTAPSTIVTGPRRFAHGALMRRADAVVAVSEAVRDETIRVFGLSAERLLTIPNAVDPVRLQPVTGRQVFRAQLGIPDDAVVILSLGALTWEKDPLAALAITATARGAERRAVHVFAGEGPLRGELERLVRREVPDGQVRVLGPRADVGDVLAASDLLLLASRVDGMEGMPATVIEAGFAALPVAAYGVAGVAEVVLDGETGLVCRPGDAPRLSAAVAELVGDPAGRDRLGAAAAERCRARYAITSVAPAYLRLYERLVAGPAARPGRLPAGGPDTAEAI